MLAENRILHSDNHRLNARVADLERDKLALTSEVADLRTKLEVMHYRVERMSRRIFGSMSERHVPGQQRIDLDLPSDAVVVEAEVSVAPTAGAADTTSAARPRGSRTGHPGRRRLPGNLDVVVEPVDIPEAERFGPDGQLLRVIGHRTTDKLDYRAGGFFIRRIQRAIYGVPFSEAEDRIIAPMPACVVTRGRVTDAVLARIVVEKFADHLPLYRQESRTARDGVPLGRSTMVGYVAAAAKALAPIWNALGDIVRDRPYLHLDDTPVDLLDPGRGTTATSRIWVYRSGDTAYFQFSRTREGRWPQEFLADYTGFIVADAYAGHEALFADGKATAVGCWAHARRKFSDIKDRPPAQAVVEEIQGLYAIEREIRGQPPDRCRDVRQERSLPLLTRLRQRLLAIGDPGPSSDLGHAIAYSLGRWEALSRYLDHGFLPIDNNPAERALRPFAIGRKNWLFFGAESGGERAAILASVIENCRIVDIDPYAYLVDVFREIHRGALVPTQMTPQALAGRFTPLRKVG